MNGFLKRIVEITYPWVNTDLTNTLRRFLLTLVDKNMMSILKITSFLWIEMSFDDFE